MTNSKLLEKISIKDEEIKELLAAQDEITMTDHRNVTEVEERIKTTKTMLTEIQERYNVKYKTQSNEKTEDIKTMLDETCLAIKDIEVLISTNRKFK